MAKWDVILADGAGTQLERLNQNSGFELVLGFDGIGQWRLSPSVLRKRLFYGVFDNLPDRRIEFWRSGVGVKNSLQAVGFIRRGGITYDSIALNGPDQNDLLNRRIIAYAAGTSQADKTAEADDMMKEIVRENLGGSVTDAARDITSSGFSIAGDVTLAPSVDLQFAWRPLMGTLKKIAKASEEAGTRVYFRVVPISPTSFEFRTWINQPGQDLTNKLTFSIDRGLISPTVDIDYAKEINYVYAGGQGQGTARDVQEVSDAGRIAASVYNRREGWKDARHVDDDSNAVRDAGYTLLNRGRPIRNFKAQIRSTKTVKFGRDWHLGDLVKAAFKSQWDQTFISFNAVVARVKIGVNSDGDENISAILEWKE